MVALNLTPLMRASAIGHVGLVKDLVRDYDVNARGPRGATALMFAAASGNLEIVRTLVEEGADLELTEDGGWDASRHAEEDGHKDIVEFLNSHKIFTKPIKLKWSKKKKFF